VRRGPLSEFLALPLILLTVVLLGGVRVETAGTLLFVAPPLVCLIMAALLVVLAWRGGLLVTMLTPAPEALADASHALTLVALFAASAQVLNSVLPERGLFHWLLVAFLLWTLWTSLFLPFDGPRLLRSLAALLLTAFVLKHVLLSALHAPQASWSHRILSTLLEGVTLGAFDLPAFAPATGYVSFFAVALYVVALLMLEPARKAE
jgi:hypothetical protein